jgi:hypothetical protein
MARGIHLKQLRTTDLEAIGVSDHEIQEASDGEIGRPVNLLAEADPVLARTVDEVREGLEATLQILDDALFACASKQVPPGTPPEGGS